MPAGGGWQVALDGRGVKTALGRPQVVPSRALADALAAEWDAQGPEVDAATLPLRDLADFAIDVAATAPEATIAAIVPYGETDTLCYRADPEEALYARQHEVWEPVLTAFETRLSVRLRRVSGIIAAPQPEETLARLRAQLARQDAFTLAATQMLASLAASLVVALSALEPGADIDALWAAANLEEDWQADLWGHDWEAEAARERRQAAFRLASRFAALAREDG